MEPKEQEWTLPPPRNRHERRQQAVLRREFEKQRAEFRRRFISDPAPAYKGP